MKKLVILGGKGIGMIAAYVASCLPDIEIIGFLNDGEPKGASLGRFTKIPVLGPVSVRVNVSVSPVGVVVWTEVVPAPWSLSSTWYKQTSSPRVICEI